jgi:transposase, IS30 family
MKYKHLSLEEREYLMVGLAQGLSFRQISKGVMRSHTTLSREFKHNQQHQGREPMGKYVACKAQVKTQKRASEQRQKNPLKCPFVYLYVREKLRCRWSPEQISGRLSLEYPKYSIHHETIYRYIYSRPVRNKYKLYEYLPLQRNKRMAKGGRSIKRTSRLGIPSIDLRPVEVASRHQVGHWETDNMEGLKSDKQVVSVTVERKIRFVHLSPVRLDSLSKAKGVIDGLSMYPSLLRNSITFDNGPENGSWRKIEQQLAIHAYVCHPYHSWEKGTVENIIGRLRRYLPKKQTLSTVTNQELSWIQDQMNHTPRKCLGFKTPHEVMDLTLAKIAL